MLEVLTNPRCSKCRQTLALLETRGLSYRVRNYLENPLSLEELQRLAQRLGQPPSQWMREVVGTTPEEQLQALAQRPELLQRPIVIRGERAAVTRTPEALSQLLEKEG
jgi:arsenate reductase